MMTDSPIVGGKIARRGSAVRGAVTGILVGVLGGAVFLGALYLPSLGIPEIFLWYSNPEWNRHLNPMDYSGLVVVGAVFSALLSAFVEAAVVGRMDSVSRCRAGLLAGGCYLVVLGGLGYLAWFAPAKLVGSPPNLVGLDMASPFALVTWVFIAGALHAARRPTHQG